MQYILVFPPLADAVHTCFKREVAIAVQKPPIPKLRHWQDAKPVLPKELDIHAMMNPNLTGVQNYEWIFSYSRRSSGSSLNAIRFTARI